MLSYCHGNERAFRRLHRCIDAPIRKVVRQYICEESDVDDVLQRTYIKAHQTRARFEIRQHSPNRSVLAWYHTIARHLAVDHLRSTATATRRQLEMRSSFKQNTWQAEEDSPPAPALRKARLKQELRSLPLGQRRVLELHWFKNLPMAQVARILEIRAGTARVRAHRAYKILHKKLKYGSRTSKSTQTKESSRHLPSYFSPSDTIVEAQRVSL